MFNWTVFKKLNQSNSAKKMSTIFFIMFGVWSVSIFLKLYPFNIQYQEHNICYKCFK